MSVTPEDVDHVAHLARLAMSDEEKGRFVEELGRIFDYMQKLAEVDTTDVEPLFHPLPLSNVMRDDVVEAPLARDALLRNAPEAFEGYFVVPRVIES
jgi:aspartyl-tRNA(Asn)/glutamyl-tRNA(Gln) amidotransferase subunit C